MTDSGGPSQLVGGAWDGWARAVYSERDTVPVLFPPLAAWNRGNRHGAGALGRARRISG